MRAKKETAKDPLTKNPFAASSCLVSPLFRLQTEFLRFVYLNDLAVLDDYGDRPVLHISQQLVENSGFSGIENSFVYFLAHFSLLSFIAVTLSFYTFLSFHANQITEYWSKTYRLNL